MSTEMSTVIDEKKRINAEIPMNLYQKIEATGYKTTEAIVKGFEKLLEEDGDSNFDEQIKQMENKILAANSRTEAKVRQISELSSWIEEKDRLISSLDARIRKLTAPKQKTWPHYIAGISTFQIWSIGFSFLLGMLFMSAYFYYYI
ncbi:hypothetical protein [Methanosarcina acetivorans]|uniref:Uncharacterized protein n=1 Tax=Methanosarcina acetivorans (strain ATCC 35395 / DSM 2834 / JCM 12185 / C2A) TaxID=188937 RepID=Q8TIL8_METAC|nr:hypothetical protein [Methanosarcina acetivorans]AAM07477.1 predicted protein [Methanosarcina acetivorans C2A]